MPQELIILSSDEFGLLLFHIDKLPFKEARLLEAELKGTYRECLGKWHELEILANKIRDKQVARRKQEKGTKDIEVLIRILIDHNPIEFEKEILAGELI